MVFCYYLTAVPSQSACSADSSPKGRAKGCYRIRPPNYNLTLCRVKRIPKTSMYANCIKILCIQNIYCYFTKNKV